MGRNDNITDDYLSINVSERTFDNDISVHLHECYEIEICLSGKGVITINNKEFPINPNTLIFIAPSDSQKYKIDETVKIINITFPPNCIGYSQIQDLLFIDNCFAIPIDDETCTEIVYLIRRIAKECDSKNYMNEKYVSHLMSCLIILLLRLKKDNSSDKKDYIYYPIPIQKAIHYIISNFKEPLTLEGVADFLGMSPGHLSREFHKSVGIGFKDFIIDLRLKRAMQLLICTDESITNIAYYCGFNSTSYFLRIFKKKYDVSPLKYRNSEKNNTL